MTKNTSGWLHTHRHIHTHLEATCLCSRGLLVAHGEGGEGVREGAGVSRDGFGVGR